MTFSKKEIVVGLVILLVTLFLRVPGLGYSHYYGDETKTLYLRKDISAKEFLLNQRKGPVQFLAAWGAEKVSGGYNEKAIRLPFALAGTLSVFVFYLIVKELFNWRVGALSALLFSLNGFNIAFSRTVQYQSFLVFFGLTSILFALYSLKDKGYLRKFFFFATGITLALAYLSHYDALFFDIAVAVIYYKLLKDSNWNRDLVKQMLFYAGIPFLFVVAQFYLPYISGGYFKEHTLDYLSRRVSGERYLENNSLFTFGVYNQLQLWGFLLLFSIVGFVGNFGWKKHLLMIWFIVPLFLFEVVFSNPGTHIHNYFIPLYIFSAIGILSVGKLLKKEFAYIYSVILGVVVGLVFVFSAYYYVPGVNNGYPWRESSIFGYKVPKVSKDFHLFTYGFPYYRSWDQVRAYFENKGAPRSFYTNDNVTIGEYYLYGIDVHKPSSTQLPQYFIYVQDNQEFSSTSVDDLHNGILKNYLVESEFSTSQGESTLLLRSP